MRKNKKGFALIELVIVIAVMAILSSVLLPTFIDVIEQAKMGAAISNASTAFKEYWHAISSLNANDDIDTVCDLKGYVIIIENGSKKSDYKFIVQADGTLTEPQKVDHNIKVDPIEIDEIPITQLGLIREENPDFMDSDGLIFGCYIYYTSDCLRPSVE